MATALFGRSDATRWATLVCSFWKGKQDLLPWLVTALLAIITEKLVPGRWYILTGGIGGALVTALLLQREKGKKGAING